MLIKQLILRFYFLHKDFFFFFLRCHQTGSYESHQNVACGDVDEQSWSGIVMKSSCSSHDHQSTNECQTVKRLNMTLQREVPVFDSTQNKTYRSIACARCNNKSNFSLWGLKISCTFSRGPISTPVNITAVKSFLKEHSDCSWKYAPMQNRKQQYKHCVLHDTRCVSNQLPVMSVVKELCYSYSMVFSVAAYLRGKRLTNRNPHCALCNPEVKSARTETELVSIVGCCAPPLSILLDVSSNIVDQEEQPSFISEPVTPKLVPHVLNCSSTMNNCTVTIGGKICEVLNSTKNQTTRMLSSLNKSRVMLIRSKENSFDKKDIDLKGNTTFILCPANEADLADKDPKHGSTILAYITFVGTSLSIISLCFLLSVYLSFKELRNLPGKCLINLSLALLCYQSVFLGAAKSTEVDPLCKAVAIFLHFFILVAFSWMSVMAFDTASTFTVQGKLTV